MAERNPKALSLKALFPSIDLVVIESVLDSHAGSEERAVESLLAMTDDRFEPEPRAAAGADTAESDASYARALALEEEEQAAHAAALHAASRHRTAASPASGAPTPEAPFDPNNIPYQPRVRRNPGQRQAQRQYSSGGYQPQAEYGSTFGASRDGGGYQGQGQQQGPGLEEQFQKLAVSGKKTFDGFMASGFVKGLKEKVANVQNNLASAGQGQNSRPTSDYASSDPSFSSSGRPSTPSRASSAGAAAAGATSAPGRRPQTQNPDFPASEWAIPLPPSRSNSTQAQIHVNPPSPSGGGALALPAGSGSATGRRSDELARSAQTGGRQSPTAAAGGLSSSPGGGKIDFAKLGLLPRQKISLDGRPTSPSASPSPSTPAVAPSAAAAAAAAPPPSIVRKIEPAPARGRAAEESDDDDDDDLGYTKSPFDD